MTTLGVLPNESDRAFGAYPRTDRYYPASSCEEVRSRVLACVERGEGPALIVGAAGVGKTMLLEVLAETLRDNFSVVQLMGSQAGSTRGLRQSILRAMDLPCRDREDEELHFAIIEGAQNEAVCPQGLAILVDEAQSLSAELLEELRGLSNLSRRGEPLIRLVLAGGAAIEDRFAMPEMEIFNQRLAARCYLSPLNYEETLNYIRAQVAAAGGSPDDAFDAGSLDAVYQATEGILRLVNQLCDRALVLAVSEGRRQVDADMVQLAWSDLHQLPAPWHSPDLADEAIGGESNVVEFGLLEEGSTAEPVDLLELQEARSSCDAPPVLNEGNLDEAPVSPRDESPEEAPRSQEDSAANPFDEEYAEEEVILDHFATLDEVFHSETPRVLNHEDRAFSARVKAVVLESSKKASEGESTDREESSPTEEERVDVLSIETATETKPGTNDLSASEEEILVIEADPVGEAHVSATAVRQEYRELFTQLRRG